MSDKTLLRAHFKQLRKTLKDPQKDEEIAKRLLENFEFSSYFVYLSFGSEVGTQPLLERLKAANKKICVPLVRGETMLSVPISDKLKKGAFGIWEPEEGEDELCEVSVVPMLAFEKNGFRLGYGGGYYDRYFATHPAIFRLGIAYEGQYSEECFFEPFDEPLDALVTEQEVRLFSDRARRARKCGS